MLKCNVCVNFIPDDSEFCPYCGNKIIYKIVDPIVSYEPEALLKRAFLFLEEGLVDKADTYVEAVLNQDPENGEAYLAKLLIFLNVKNIDDLATLGKRFDDNINYKRAFKYGDQKLKDILVTSHMNCVDAINKREEQNKCTDIYNKARDLMDFAIQSESISYFKAAIALFNEIPQWKDSREKILNCEKYIADIKVKIETKLEEDPWEEILEESKIEEEVEKIDNAVTDEFINNNF